MSDTRLVIGHGPCALRAAAVLAAGGAKVTLLQRGATPSGLRNPDFPTETGRIHVDSAYRSASESVFGSLVEAPDTERAVLARGRIHRLPMSRMEVHQLLDDAARLPAARAWVRARSRNAMADVMGGGQEERSHKDWVVRRMGEPAWAHLYRSYAEKRWGLPSEELSVGLARLYHGVEDDRPAQLVGGGEGQALAQAEKCILDAGGEIRTNVTVKRLEVVDGKVAKVVVNRGKKYATNGQVWIAEAPGVIAEWLEGAISHQTKVAAMRLEVQPAVRVALRGDTKGLPWDLHILDEWVPFHRVVSPYGVEQTAIFHANGAMDEPDDEALAFLFAEAADRAGLGRFEVESANVERLDAWVPVWSRGAHAVLRTVLLDWESLGIVGVGRSGAFSPLDPGEEVSLALRYRDADALNQRETHRVYLDPPVRVEDLDVHITRFVER